MIEVNITGENTFADDHLDQYDYGQSLRMCGDIPSPVEVQFSLQRSGGEAPRNLGVEVDGAVEVSIPDEMLRNNGATHDYNIYAFIYIRDETSGETTHRIIIPVKSRPKPGEYLPPGQPDFPEQLIQSVMQERQKAEDAAEKAEKASIEVSEEAKRAIDEYVEEKKESLKGEPGEPGTNGKSAYEYAVAGGYTGTEEEFRNMLATDVPTISELKGDLANKLERPATAQVGQIFRVQAVNEDGTYVLEAVDMPSAGGTQEDDSWKEEPVLIISIEEECASIYIDKISGEPFEFEEMAGYVQIPVSSAGNVGYGRLCVGLNKELAASYEGLVCMNANGSPGKNQKGIFEIKKEYGMWHTLNTATTESSWLDLNSVRNAHWDTLGKFASVETITSFTLIPYSGTFSPGGTIKIYGKPAKGATTA